MTDFVRRDHCKICAEDDLCECWWCARLRQLLRVAKYVEP